MQEPTMTTDAIAENSPITEDEWHHFIGPDADYYIECFSNYKKVDLSSFLAAPWKSQIIINKSSCFRTLSSLLLSPAFYFLYRKMYVYACMTVFVIVSLLLLNQIFALRIIDFVLLVYLLIGIQADYWYYHFARKKILAMRRQHGSSVNYLKKLEKEGGRNRVAATSFAITVIGLAGLWGGWEMSIAIDVKQAMTAFKEKHYSETISLCDKILQKDSRRIPVYVLRGKSYYLIGQYDKAMSDCKDVLALDQWNIQANALQGMALIMKKQPQEALKNMDQLLTVKPQAASAHYVRAFALLQMRSFEPALEAVGKALQLEPNNANFQSLNLLLKGILDEKRRRGQDKEQADLSVFGPASTLSSIATRLLRPALPLPPVNFSRRSPV